jgi:hypothetical protein
MQMAAHWAKTAAVPDVKATLNKNCINSPAGWEMMEVSWNSPLKSPVLR